jgi:HlyD family secretion protein
MSRGYLPVRGRLRALLCVTVWLGAAGAAVWLYRQTGGMLDAVAIAQAKEYRVSPAQIGRLIALEVTEGQLVTPGQVLARFDTERIRQEISAAEAQFERSFSEALARSEAEACQVELESARSSQARDRDRSGKLEDDIDREQKLVQSGLAGSERLMSLEPQRAAIEEAVRNWPVRVQAIETRCAAAEARLEEWWRAHTTSPGGRLEPSRDRVRQQQEELRLLATRMDRAVLQASARAYVAVIHARPGSVVKAGEPVLTLVEAQPRQAIAYIEEHSPAVLPTGTKVLARRRGSPDQQFEAVVGTVAGEVSELPSRIRSNPRIPAWGRAVYLNLPEQATVDPGELLDIIVPRASAGGPFGDQFAGRRTAAAATN